MIVGSWKVVVLDASNHLLHFYMLTDSLVTAAATPPIYEYLMLPHQ